MDRLPIEKVAILARFGDADTQAMAEEIIEARKLEDRVSRLERYISLDLYFQRLRNPQYTHDLAIVPNPDDVEEYEQLKKELGF